MPEVETRVESGDALLRRGGRSFLALGLGNYGAMAVSLVTNAWLARRLGVEEYGQLALLLMASQVMMLVAVNWTHAGFVRFGAGEFVDRRTAADALWTRLGIVLPTAAAAALVLVAARGPITAYLGVPVSAVGLLLLHFTALAALSIVGAVFQARQEMARYGLTLLLDKTAMFVCVAWLPAAWTSSAVPALTCLAVCSSLVACWGVWVVGGSTWRPRRPSSASFRRMAAFSLPLLLTTWAGLFGTNWFDLVILNWYVPVGGIGLYSVATQLAGVMQQVTVVFATLLLPELSVMVVKGQSARIRSLVERGLPYWLLATSLLFAVVIMGARIGVPLVFGESYGGAVPVLAWLMLASCALALFNSCTSLAGAFGATWVMTGVSFASTTVNVVMNLLLIPVFGIIGSAMATVAAYVVGAGCMLVFVQRRVGVPVVRLSWLAGPAVAAFLCFQWIDGMWFYPAAIAAVLGSALVLVRRFGLFRAEDLAVLGGLTMMPSGLRARLAGKGL